MPDTVPLNLICEMKGTFLTDKEESFLESLSRKLNVLRRPSISQLFPERKKTTGKCLCSVKIFLDPKRRKSYQDCHSILRDALKQVQHSFLQRANIGSVFMEIL